jgi:hypothetical protein
MQAQDDRNVASPGHELQELNNALLDALHDAVELHRTLREHNHLLLVWFAASVRGALSRAQESENWLGRYN